jgi:hypothetical protein
MALSLGVHKGDKIFVGAHCLEVRAITPSPDPAAGDLITVAIDGGEEMVVTDRSKSNILPGVLAFSGVGAKGAKNRLALEAPRNIPIRRLDARAESAGGGTAQTATDIALLAPVPRDILESGLETETLDGRTAFGTKDWKLFNKLDQMRAAMPVDVYIYESHPGGGFTGKATWHAVYVRLEAERHIAQPYRPKLAAETDHWDGEVYWIVARLRRMEPNQHIRVADFTGCDRKKPYGIAFPPHRPLLVKHP